MKTQNILFFALIMFFSAACDQSTTNNAESNSAPEVAISKPIVVSPAEFKEKMNLPEVQIIDVRTDEEVVEGMIPNAIQMNLLDGQKFKDAVETLDPEKPVLVYCKSGGRSAKAAEYMVENGFKEVYDLNGGYTDWVATGGNIQMSE